ncbi:MAG: DNA repair protein RecN [Bacteroidota bacterium]
MLHRLTIQNYVLIDSLDVKFSKGLTAITGETGAGKSILLGAMGLILGNRADLQVLLNKEKKCFVEGEFNIADYHLKDFFYNNELDYEAVTIIRREITPEGKSRAFINDTPVNLNILKELGIRLVDIHSQHETLTLNNSSFQLSVVDVYANHSKDLNLYKTAYNDFVKLKSKLNELSENEKKAKADVDYFQFQYNELESANLKIGEKEEMEQELQTLNNAEEIKSGLSKAHETIQEGESNILQQISFINTTLNSISKFNSKISELAVRIQSSYVELKDIASELELVQEEINFNPERIEVINDRLNIIYKLEQKHRVNSVDDLLKIENDLSEKLLGFQTLDDDIKKLTIESEKKKTELLKLAAALSANRKTASVKIEKEIKKMLAEVGIPNAVLKIEITKMENDSFNARGIDSINYLFSANKGIVYQELNRVASGGELSRLMLCIKAMIAKLTSLPTIIFDEIDTGVSGEIAFKVGTIIKKISDEHQVIAITHLPQMASKGDAHYLVYKESGKNSTSTKVKELSSNERVNEIAKMLSGEKLSAVAIENAKELLKM